MVVFGLGFAAHRLLIVWHHSAVRHRDTTIVSGRVREVRNLIGDDQEVTVAFADASGQVREIRKRNPSARRLRVGSAVPIAWDPRNAHRVFVTRSRLDSAIDLGLAVVFGLVPLAAGLMGRGATLAEAMSGSV